MKDLKEIVVAKIRKRIEATRFKSKVEVARLALDEYEKEQGSFYRKKLKGIRKRLEKLEILSTRQKNQIDSGDFNEGYNRALLDYGIFTKKQINKHMATQSHGKVTK